MDGTPVTTWQEGEWNDRWNRFETKYEKLGAVQIINGEVTKSKEKASDFKNPTMLWFWRTTPKVGESVVVSFIAQNFIARATGGTTTKEWELAGITKQPSTSAPTTSKRGNKGDMNF